MTRQIIIDIDDQNSFTVREGDRFADGLCWDEMLGSIAELTHPRVGSARYAMRTAAQWDAWRESMRASQHRAFDELQSPGQPK
ncbi:hypothetical protein SAMN05445504_2415 [Burkholderia sp. CF099]|nr:hypothetical protein SAMN05445504_2415 [Burkholderia sp. CF099]